MEERREGDGFHGGESTRSRRKEENVDSMLENRPEDSMVQVEVGTNKHTMNRL